MTAFFSRLSVSIARAAAACAAALALASCGGGGVSANPSPIVDSPTLTILPATAVMYSGLPTTFVLSGGTGAYVIASSDQAVLQVAGGVTGRSVTLVPNNVTADTSVTLTVRDTGSAAPVSATVTVRPGTVNNNLTITPNSTQDASCSPAVCSGGDAEVTVTVSQGGIPLAARGVRFEVISGSFSFVASASGVIERAGAAFVTTTDETGTARAKIQVAALAPNQTALVRVTDMATGAYRQASFPIAQFTGNTPAFFTLPTSITFTGPFAGVCATNASSDVSIFGGTPPYAISGGSSAFYMSPTTVTTNGGKFSVIVPNTASCTENAAIGVTDATGRTLIVTVTNQAGTGTQPPATISLAPRALSLRCGLSATVVVVGGTDPFAVSSDHPRVSATITAPDTRTVTIRRLPGDLGINYPTTATVTVTDGTSMAEVAISIVDAAGTSFVKTCP